MKLRKRVQFGRVWRYLALVVDGIRGQLQWTWISNMRGESVATAVDSWLRRPRAGPVSLLRR